MKNKRKVIKKAIKSLFEDEKELKDDEVSLKTLMIIFSIGIVIIGGLYLYSTYTNSQDVSREDRKDSLRNEENISEFNKDLNIIKTEDESDFLVEEIEENMMLIEDFENVNINNFRIIKGLEAFAKVSFSNETYYEDQEKSLKIEYQSACSSEECWAVVQKNIRFGAGDWRNYSFVNIRLKSNGVSGWFEFNMKDVDGDRWIYYNTELLSNIKDWTLIKIPIQNIKKEWWSETGNGIKDLDKIQSFQITLANEGDKTVYFDKIFLS